MYDVKMSEFEAQVNFLHDKMMEFRHELIKEINCRSDRFKDELELILKKQYKNGSATNHSHNGVKSRRDTNGELPEKQFKHRESLLTELFKIDHIRTFRHIFISMLIILCSQILISDYTTQGKLNLDFELLLWNFSGLTNTMIHIWLPMQLCGLFVVYFMLKVWSQARQRINRLVADILYTTLFSAYMGVFMWLPVRLVADISLSCRIIILTEQVRILMKTYAFVRCNVPRVLANTQPVPEKDESSVPKQVLPEFSKYLYYMFAPTLVYRDEYPRTSRVRWGLVWTYFFEIIGSVIYTYCLFDRFCVPFFRTLNVKQLGLKSYVNLISICIMPGALIQIMIFFAFLHAWNNAWAEMLRFGDRQFYLDWWNSTSYNNYYRTWNTLVQDWLYNYIYRDLYKLFNKNRSLSQFGVIFISSVFHEHILSFSFGFFYPIMFVLFSFFGFVCMYIPRGSSAAWNIFIWTSLFTGLGIQICLFSIEWYARQTNQCPRSSDSLVDFLIPRSILCLF